MAKVCSASEIVELGTGLMAVGDRLPRITGQRLSSVRRLQPRYQSANHTKG